MSGSAQVIGLPRKTIFIDRNSGGRVFRKFITDNDIHVVLHDEQFQNPKTEDHVWLKKIGSLGWAMVTGDIACERSFLFLDALKRSRAHVFILCGLNHSNPEEKARCVVDAYPDIVVLCHKHNGPCLWKAKAGCKIQPLDFRETLGLLKKKMKRGDVRM
jgi:hypothetical protein